MVARDRTVLLTVVLSARGAGSRVLIAEISRADDANCRALRGERLAAVTAKMGTLRADVAVLEATDDMICAIATLTLAVATRQLVVWAHDC